MLAAAYVMTACTTTYTPIEKYEEDIIGKPKLIQDVIQTGEVVKVITHTGKKRWIIVDRIEGEKLLVGRDRFLSEIIVKIPLTDIKEIHVTRTRAGEPQETTLSPTEIIYGAVGGTLWMLGDTLQRHGIDSATAFYPGGSVTVGQNDRYQKTGNGDKDHETTSDEIFKYVEERKDINKELGILEYAKYTISRNGDMDKTYRLLEQVINSRHAVVRKSVKQFIKNNTMILEGARHSFTIESLEESIAKYGDSAKKIESDRLDVYKTIAPSDDYSQARKNYESVFGNLD